jgi:hypothetical protein
MTEGLAQAIALISRLPDADREAIARALLLHIEKLRALRVKIDEGVRSLDAGEGYGLDVEEFLRQKTRMAEGGPPFL